MSVCLSVYCEETGEATPNRVCVVSSAGVVALGEGWESTLSTHHGCERTILCYETKPPRRTDRLYGKHARSQRALQIYAMRSIWCSRARMPDSNASAADLTIAMEL